MVIKNATQPPNISAKLILIVFIMVLISSHSSLAFNTLSLEQDDVLKLDNDDIDANCPHIKTRLIHSVFLACSHQQKYTEQLSNRVTLAPSQRAPPTSMIIL